MGAQDRIHREGDTVHGTFDWDVVAPSTAVLETVAFAVERDPMELDALYDAIDFDAFDALIDPAHSSRQRSELSIAFNYYDHSITAYSDGDVVVNPTTAIT